MRLFLHFRKQHIAVHVASIILYSMLKFKKLGIILASSFIILIYIVFKITKSYLFYLLFFLLWSFLLFIYLFIYLFLSYYCCSSTVISIFPPPLPSTTAIPNSPPFGFVHVSFIHALWWPLPFFPMLFPSPLPSSCCQLVLYFHVLSLFLTVLWPFKAGQVHSGFG